MKKVMVIAGQNDADYGQRITYRKVKSILKEKKIECVYPKISFRTMALVPFYDAVIISGSLKKFFESAAIIDIALEFGKPVFFFGVNLQLTNLKMLSHLSTEIMSDLLTGFVTDETSARWASLWSNSKISAGADMANLYLLERAQYEKGKFAVFAPSRSGILKDAPDEEWFPQMDSRIIVEDPKDSKTAVKFARKIKAEDVSLVFKIEDVIEAIKNAKFVLSEKFYVSLTAVAFETPFLNVGEKITRYLGKELSKHVCKPDITDMAVAFSTINDFDLSQIKIFNSKIENQFDKMNKAFDKFIESI